MKLDGNIITMLRMQLLKIVDDHDKQEIDNHLMASSRLMLKRQLRQDTVDREAISDFLKVPKSSNGSGDGDRTDYRSSSSTYANSSSTYDRYSKSISLGRTTSST